MLQDHACDASSVVPIRSYERQLSRQEEIRLVTDGRLRLNGRVFGMAVFEALVLLG